MELGRGSYIINHNINERWAQTAPLGDPLIQVEHRGKAQTNSNLEGSIRQKIPYPPKHSTVDPEVVNLIEKALSKRSQKPCGYQGIPPEATPDLFKDFLASLASVVMWSIADCPFLNPL